MSLSDPPFSVRCRRRPTTDRIRRRRSGHRCRRDPAGYRCRSLPFRVLLPPLPILIAMVPSPPVRWNSRTPTFTVANRVINLHDASKADFYWVQFSREELPMTSLATVDSLDIQVIVDNVTDSLSSRAVLHRDRAGRPGTAPRRRLGAGRQLPVLRRARAVLPAHREERRRRTPHRAVRHRAGGSRVRAERLAARRSTSAPVEAMVLSARPLGPCRRHAARAAARASTATAASAVRCYVASRHVPQPRARQMPDGVVPSDGGRSLASAELDRTQGGRVVCHAPSPSCIADDTCLRERRDPAPHRVRARPARPALGAPPDGEGWEPDRAADRRALRRGERGAARGWSC